MDQPRCRNCGCEPEIHQHYHDRTYCGRHGKEMCPRWVDGRGWWARLRDALRR